MLINKTFTHMCVSCNIFVFAKSAIYYFSPEFLQTSNKWFLFFYYALPSENLTNGCSGLLHDLQREYKSSHEDGRSV